MSDISSQDLVKVLADRIVRHNVAVDKNVGIGRDDSLVVRGKKELSEMLETLYRNSIKDNFYFFDCPVAVYKNKFEERFDEFKLVNVDAERKDFIESELRNIYYPEGARLALNENYHSFSHGIESFKITINKKKTFLKEELLKEGRCISNEPVDISSVLDEIPLDNELRFDDVDVKDIKDISVMLTSNQIVILLSEVGFFNDKKIYSLSQSKQANLVRKITGLDVKNLQNNISKLSKKPSVIGARYIKDIDLVKSLLDDK